MSVYIKGMEMPKNCDECWTKFHGFGWVEHDEEWGTFYCKAGKGFCSDPRTKCPLIPVPDHGRLIDADEIIKEHNQHYEYLSDEFYVTVRDIENATTIIPADKEDGE